MKRKIHSYDQENGIMTIILKNRLVNFYLTNSLKKRFGESLEVGYLVEFKPDYRKTKIINHRKCIRVNHFTKISRQTNRKLRVHYDIKNLREKIINEITKSEYYLFLDLEMTMPPYYPVKNFLAEIIQVGYYLTDSGLNIIKENDYYLKPTKFKTVSKRTLKFLNIERGSVKDPKEYKYFYDDLKDIFTQYNPKVVVWGKNDYLAIKTSFAINQQEPIIEHHSFINLLSKIKQYYNLFDDVGLFKAYEIYYNDSPVQDHHALSDAYVLFKIYDAFITRKKISRVFAKL